MNCQSYSQAGSQAGSQSFSQSVCQAGSQSVGRRCSELGRLGRCSRLAFCCFYSSTAIFYAKCHRLPYSSTHYLSASLSDCTPICLPTPLSRPIRRFLCEIVLKIAFLAGFFFSCCATEIENSATFVVPLSMFNSWSAAFALVSLSVVGAAQNAHMA